MRGVDDFVQHVYGVDPYQFVTGMCHNNQCHKMFKYCRYIRYSSMAELDVDGWNPSEKGKARHGGISSTTDPNCQTHSQYSSSGTYS